jgi:hypothetical protein
MRRIADQRSRTEQPVEVMSLTGAGVTFETVYAVRYQDGKLEELFAIDAATYPDHMAAAGAVLAAFRSYGVDLYAIERVRRATEERERQRMAEELLRKYQQDILNRMRGSFFRDASSYFTAFAERDFGRFNDRKARRPFEPGGYGDFAARPPPDPRRTAALDKCRKLKRLAASSTFAGERDNANRQKAAIMARHGIEEREL